MLMESAARGAAAGLVGGAVLAVAHRSLLPRLPDRKRGRAHAWDHRVRSAAARAGLDLSERMRTPTAIATELLACVALGVAYTVVIEQLEPSRQARKLLDAGLVYAASLMAPELERKKSPRGWRKKLRNKALERVNAPALFGRTTTLALRALAR